jgi:hypothetical protein
MQWTDLAALLCVMAGCKISGGVSNIAFSFRGNEPVRRAFHSAFLHHACKVCPFPHRIHLLLKPAVPAVSSGRPRWVLDTWAMSSAEC